jgi:hypothetical protein
VIPWRMIGSCAQTRGEGMIETGRSGVMPQASHSKRTQGRR